ncbi:MAG TPA: SIS domain-containing protein [Solirubrobacterales bacterium]|jgi:D-sedoheptulose 7-phosphate isomerase|nr:SIS domain-containing protein [Solirubrobacterales bacterium]
MAGTAAAGALRDRVATLLDARLTANRLFFEAEAERLARLCHQMAERFARGGRLVALGLSPAARTDVRHVTVEFVHPVIVGKRALPAIGLSREGGPLSEQARLVVEPEDIAIAFGADDPDGGDEVRNALALAKRRGCLTLAFTEAGAEWELRPPSDDPYIRQELAETAYHVLWELVHVFFDHRGLLSGREVGPVHDTGASSFLYPFLSESEHDLEAVVEDVRRSALLKAAEVDGLRAQTLGDGEDQLLAAADTLRRCFDGGGKLLACGNGGSATDAMDAVADLRYPPSGRGWTQRRAIDLTEDTAIITAVGNDIGTEEIFQRQVIAYGHAGDSLLVLSTSGNSENMIEALAEARRREMKTVALVGYDGGRVAADDLADHLIITRSQHIPRIQEAQASAWHVLRELIEQPARSPAR